MAEMEDRDLRDFIEPSGDEATKISDLWDILQRLQGSPDELGEVSDLERITNMANLQLTGPDGEPLPLPPSLKQVMLTAMRAMAQGDGIAVVTAPNELTTGEAADLLGISRSYLVRLIEAKELPCRRETPTSHRRLRAEDVLAFRRVRSFERKAALRRHDKESEDLGLP